MRPAIFWHGLLISGLLAAATLTACTREEDPTPAKELLVALDIGRKECRDLCLAVYKSWSRKIRNQTVSANDDLPAGELRDELRMDRHRGLALVSFLDATHARVQRDLPWDSKDRIEEVFDKGRELCAAASGVIPMGSRAYSRVCAENTEAYDRLRRQVDELIVFGPGERQAMSLRIQDLLARPIG